MNRDAVFLNDIKVAIERILKYTEGGKDTFISDELLQDGVLRNFQVMGEAARRVSEDCMSRHSDVPWSDILGMRNVIVHDYAEIDFVALWDTITKDLPPLFQQIEEVLGKMEA